MSPIPAFSVHATPESVVRWTFGRDGMASSPPAIGTPLPLAYLVFLRVQPIAGVSIHQLLDRDPDRGLYGGASYLAAQPARVGDVFDASSEVSAIREIESPRGTLAVRTLTTRYRNQGVVALEEKVRMIDLPAGPPRPPTPGPNKAPITPQIAKIAPITRVQVAWLTVETGDMNPLHLDPTYASARLFPDVVVPGTLTAAIIERELARALGRPLRALDVRLLAASYPGEPYALHADVQAGALTFSLYAGDELRAEGTAA